MRTDIYRWFREHPEVSSELLTSCLRAQCVWLCVLSHLGLQVLSKRGYSKLPVCHFSAGLTLCLCALWICVMPGASFTDGSFALVACVLMQATHSCRAVPTGHCCSLHPSPSVCGFGVPPLRMLYACQEAGSSPILAGFGFAWGYFSTNREKNLQVGQRSSVPPVDLQV